jgi:hypothetical protein
LKSDKLYDDSFLQFYPSIATLRNMNIGNEEFFYMNRKISISDIHSVLSWGYDWGNIDNINDESIISKTYVYHSWE